MPNSGVPPRRLSSTPSSASDTKHVSHGLFGLGGTVWLVAFFVIFVALWAPGMLDIHNDASQETHKELSRLQAQNAALKGRLEGLGIHVEEEDKDDDGSVFLLCVQVALAWFFLYLGGNFLYVEYRKAVKTYERLARSGAQQFDIWQHLEYRVDYWFSSSPMSKPVALLFATVFLIFTGGVLLALVSKEGFASALWTSWTFVADPGTHADQDGILERAVAFLLTVGGMLVFALLIGIIADEISSQVDSLRKGRSRVIEVDHTLILGWSDKTLPILKELSLANESMGGGTVVVLAERDKEDMEQEIKDSEIDFLGTEIICRSGSPILMSELRKVSAVSAKSTIVLAEDDNVDADGSDARALRIVLSLVGLYRETKTTRGHIVVEIRDIDNRMLVHLVGKDLVETVVSHDVIGRLMIQSARQPALAHILAELLSFDGNEIYFKEWPELTGKTFEELFYLFQDAIPIGIKQHATGQVMLGPPSDTCIAEGDQIIVIAEDDDTYFPSDRPLAAPVSPALKVDRNNEAAKPEKLMFCGWRRDIDDMVMELDKVVAEGSELYMMSAVPIKKRRGLLAEGGLEVSKLRNLTLVHRQGNTVLRRHLEPLPLEEFESILILADESYENNIQDADSRSLATLLLIRDIQQQRLGYKCEKMLVSEILDARTRSLVSVAKISDYVMSNDIVSSVIAQVSENRDANAVWSELLTDEGMETYVRPANLYGIVGLELDFWGVLARTRLYNEIAIGYKLVTQDTPVLNPDKFLVRKWEATDMIVCLAYN
eukprot:comp23617_c2_seq1/m.40189 comp23617_c2_seq1/g.40189  ORF comp23617_c2_seq1/g.40189 comp23617_c2_seq1/m.40189 type:complete len:773 (-) comp23617_c2_seq1:135-2453(-)